MAYMAHGFVLTVSEKTKPGVRQIPDETERLYEAKVEPLGINERLHIKQVTRGAM